MATRTTNDDHYDYDKLKRMWLRAADDVEGHEPAAKLDREDTLKLSEIEERAPIARHIPTATWMDTTSIISVVFSPREARQDFVKVKATVELAGKAFIIVRALRNVSAEGTVYAVSENTVTIGRHPNCDFVLNDFTVSREHCLVKSLGNRHQIEDRESLNGTYVNGARIDSATPLESGNLIGIGGFRLIFAAGKEAADGDWLRAKIEQADV
jgi:hypothetical protein